MTMNNVCEWTLDSYGPGWQAASDAYKNGTFGFCKGGDL